MNKLFSWSLALVLMLTLQSTAFSQDFFVYDGDDFSVWLETNSDKSKITGVKFSAEGQWHAFKIIDFYDLEGDSKGGFVYVVKDGAGNEFTVDYRRYADYIVVHAEDGTEWRLRRRK
jgi:hypothetical protein